MARVGMDGAVPGRVTEIPATALANRKASGKAMRSASDAVQAEFNKACMRVLLDRVGNINVRYAMLKAE